MKLTFLFTGKTDERWIDEGMAVYLKRLSHYCTTEVIVIPSLRNRGKLSRVQVLEAEGKAILDKIAVGDKLILLDESGKEMSSSELSNWINKQQISGCKRLVLAIGGAYGFHECVYAKADHRISLSKLTFTHQMVRVILAEQIYRAFTILKGEKYHHD